MADPARSGYIIDVHDDARPIDAHPIDTLAIVTRDGTERALRLADDLARSAAGRPLDVLVSDDGAAGRRAATQLEDALVDHGIERRVASFALGDPLGLGIATGANRNFVQLATLDRVVLVVDDDLEARIHVPPGTSTHAVERSGDPTEHWFFATADEASGMHDPHADPFAMLDRGLASRSPSSGSRPIASWMGMVGDPGSPNPLLWLAQEGESRRRLAPDDATFTAHRESRRVMRSVMCTTHTTGHGWTPSVVAYDHRVLVPPFLPVLRGQGLVWGATVDAGGAWGLVRVPGALAHRLAAPRQSDRAREHDSVVAPAVATLLQMAFATGPRPPKGADPAAALVHAADRLEVLTRTPETFAAWRAHALLVRVQSLDTMLARALDQHRRAPAAWASEIDDLRARLTSSAARARPPYDLADRAEPMKLAYEIAAGFAALLRAWPRIVAVVRAMGPATSWQSAFTRPPTGS